MLLDGNIPFAIDRFFFVFTVETGAWFCVLLNAVQCGDFRVFLRVSKYFC